MRDKNNKEHPIDNLFSQKLGHLEGTPSENAWQALEKGLSQKPRKKNKAIFWLPYATAAAIALLVVSVWLLRQQASGTQNNTQLANSQRTEVKQKEDRNKTAEEVPHSKNSVAQLEDKKNSHDEEQIAVQEPIHVKELAKQESIQKERAYNQPKEKSTATPTSTEEERQEKGIQPAISPLENTVAQIDEQPTVITPSSLIKEESTTIVVTVNLEEETESLPEEDMVEEETTEQFQKKSKAGKFFSTLKKIKKGDFDELGIRPETIVAYVKDRASSNNQTNEK